MCHAMHRYAKANNKYLKNYNKCLESIFLIIQMQATCIKNWGMSQKLPKNGFKWVKKLSKFDKEFIKNMMKIAVKNIFLKQMLNIQKKYLICIVIYLFQLKPPSPQKMQEACL